MVVAADIVRFVIFVGLAVAMASEAAMWAPIVAIGLSSMATAGARAAYVALMVTVVDDAQLPAANAAEAACPPVAVAANAITFGVSALLMSRVRTRAAVAAPSTTSVDSIAAIDEAHLGRANAGSVPSVFVDAHGDDADGVDIRTAAALREGTNTNATSNALRSEIVDSEQSDRVGERHGAATDLSKRTVRALTVVGGAVLFLFGAEMVAQPLVVESVLGRDVAQVGWLIAAAGAAGLLTAPIAPRLMGRVGVWPSLWLSTLTAAAAMAALTGAGQVSNTVDLPIAMGLAAVGGAAGMMFEIAVMTGLQQAVPDDVLGAAAGRFESIGSAATLVGLAAVPVLTAVMSVATMCLVLASVVVASVGVSLVLQPSRSPRALRWPRNRAVLS
jgi:hypothetical protein